MFDSLWFVRIVLGMFFFMCEVGIVIDIIRVCSCMSYAKFVHVFAHVPDITFGVYIVLLCVFCLLLNVCFFVFVHACVIAFCVGHCVSNWLCVWVCDLFCY